MHGGQPHGTTTAGYNITNSELGHLYYTELQNSFYDTNGTQQAWATYGLINKGPFANLQSYFYWSDTNYAANPGYAWYFNGLRGYQRSNNKDDYNVLGRAVRSAQVSEAVPTPIPATLPLFASGLAWLAGARLRRRGR